MAVSSGPPQGAPTGKVKKEFTDDQKRTFGLLGVAGVLFLIVAAIYLPGMLSGSTPTETVQVPVSDTTTASGETAVTPAPGEIPTGAVGDMAAAPAAAPAAATNINYTPVSKSRSDPFTPFIVNPLPPPQKEAVPPLDIPQPNSPELAPLDISGPAGGGAKEQPALYLPSINIPRMTTEIKAPRDINPPPRGSGSGNNSDPQPSYDKRLSGVVIANGVRALLEISSGGELKNYVVQPGDTVEGITVLNIQRFSEGTATITRMLIRENGQERYVDLKPAPQAAAGAGAPGALQ